MAIDIYEIPDFEEYAALFDPFWGHEHLSGYLSIEEFSSMLSDAKERSIRRWEIAKDLVRNLHETSTSVRRNGGSPEIVQASALDFYMADKAKRNAELTMTRAIMRANAAHAIAAGDYEESYRVLENFRLSSGQPGLANAQE